MRSFKLIYSINFDKIRRSPKDIIYIIFHYTGMISEKKAIVRLINKNSKVSSHYFIKRDGTIINMVPEKFTAWHAGLSCWKSHKNLNNKSIGIEIQNSGHTNKYEGFSMKQIKSLLLLTKILKKTYSIKSKNFLGHSDIAPNRKKDPGEKFPWEYLSKKKIGFWYKLKKDSLQRVRNLKIQDNEKKIFFQNLSKIGYSIKFQKNLNSNKTKYLKNITKAFQRRFRPEIVNGKIDQECLLISQNLVKK